MSSVRFRLPVALLLVLTLQSSLFDGIRVSGIHADTMLLFAIGAGIVAGPETGALVAFATGLVADLFVQTPLGLSALAFALVAFAVGAFQGSLIRAAWWITPLTVLFASAAGVVLFVVIGAMLGQAQLVHADVPLIVSVVAVSNAVLSLPFVRLAGWALPAPAR